MESEKQKVENPKVPDVSVAESLLFGGLITMEKLDLSTLTNGN